jgi:hypothetical protein
MSMVSCSSVVEVASVDDLDLLVGFLGGMVRKMRLTLETWIVVFMSFWLLDSLT